MANTKTSPLPIPQFGGAAVAKPLAPGAPLMEAGKRFMPKPVRPPKRRHAFHKGETAYSGSSPRSKGAFPG
jgi:hypothetical protein